MKYGFVKVAAAIPQVRVANPEYNCGEILRLTLEASDKGAEIIVFPELSVTGYTCQDLFRQQTLLQGAESGVASLLEGTCQTDIIAIVGVPVAVGPLLLNCALVMQHGAILGIVPKTYLPNYSEFYEKRWFASASDLQAETIRYAGQEVLMSPQLHLFTTAYGVKFGIELCEDVWAPLPPSNRLALAGADIIFNLSASDELIGKHNYLLSLLAQQSARTICGYVYSGCGFGESTQDVVYGGNAYSAGSGTAEASGNEVTLTNTSVSGTVMAGYARNRDSGGAISENNVLTLRGGTYEASIYGGHALADQGMAKAGGNTVTLQGQDINRAAALPLSAPKKPSSGAAAPLSGKRAKRSTLRAQPTP